MGTLRHLRRRGVAFTVILVFPLIMIGVAAPVSLAADGNILRTINAENYACDVGTGIAFDGSNLLLSCDGNNTITAVNPANGSFARSYTISGVPAIGALAWDRGRGLLWACGGFNGDDTIVYRINLDTQVATEAFGGTEGCPDGLAFDGTDDTLYLSADVANTVQHYKADGALIESIDVTGKLGSCGNSGIAVGGPYIFLANNGCSQIYRAAKNDLSAPTLFGTYPARIEDMECDDLTFRADSKAAIWTKDAYDNVLNAFELNAGDCGFGGQPPGSPNADTDGDGLSDNWETNGIDVDHNGTIDLDIKAMGADPQHKDIFLEVDWMTKPKSCIWFICWGGQDFTPQPAALSDVRAAFAASPVTNPDGTTGVRMHIDSGPNSIMNPVTGATWGSTSRANEVPFQEKIGRSNGNTYNWTAFDNLRSSSFTAARRNAFHYMVFADTYAGPTTANCPSGTCSSGVSRGIPASDTLVTDGDSSWGDGFTRIQERGTVMHELGHNLNLHHGGADETNNYNPAYASIMNYYYQLTGLPPNARLDYSREAPYVDWDHLVFTGGSVGAFGDDNRPTATPSDDTDPANLKSTGRYAVDGDGTVKFVGPTLLVPGTSVQQLAMDVTNASKTQSAYTVRVDITDLRLSKTATTTIAAGATKRVNIPVDTTGLRPGRYALNADLASPNAGSDLSTDSATITVPDLSDPSQLQQARDALESLRTLPADSGLDPSVRSGLVTSLTTTLPWTAKATFITSPRTKITGTYTIQPPTFKPNATTPQSIVIIAAPGSPSLKLNLARVPRSTPGVFIGTLHAQRPQGGVLDATVLLTWSSRDRTLTGIWTGRSSGVLTVKLTAP